MLSIREQYSAISPADTAEVVGMLQARPSPLQTDQDLDPIIDRISNAHSVLIGEASHGIARYHSWRARLTQRLIRERDFEFVSVQGDWPDCYQVNRYVKGLPSAGTSARDVLETFERWPTWMWANEEVERFADWLREYNLDRPPEQRLASKGSTSTACGSRCTWSSSTWSGSTRGSRK